MFIAGSTLPNGVTKPSSSLRMARLSARHSASGITVPATICYWNRYGD